MFERFGKLFVWVAAAVLLLQAAPASTQAVPTPPLLPGEFITVLSNGCSIISNGATLTAAKREESKRSLRSWKWRGECRYGLVHGTGTMVVTYQDGATTRKSETTQEYFFGRPDRGKHEGDGGKEIWYATPDGRVAAASRDFDLMRPVWADWIYSDATRSMVSANGRYVSTELAQCATWGNPDCLSDYGIRDRLLSDTTPAPVIPCPDPHTSVGCEGLWREHAGPLYATYQAIAAEVERNLPIWRSQLAQLNAPREARFAAIDEASRQAMARSQAAAQAEAGKGDRDFQAKLAAVNAGQLYAMADEFERAGDNDRAGQALRALLTRFPNHALAVTAAQHLSSLGPSAPSGAPCDAAAEEIRLAAGLNAAMSRIPRSNAVWQMESILWTTDRIASAYARCPTLANSSAKVRTYSAVYLETARNCAVLSPTGACTPQMH